MVNDDIDNFIKVVKKQNKRKFQDTDNDEIINDLKWIAYDTIVDFIVNNKSNTNRQISLSLNILEKIFKDSSILFCEMTKDQDIKLTMKTFSIILNKIIEDIRLEIYSSKNFNFHKYIKLCKNKLNNKKACFIDDIGLKFDCSLINLL